MATDGAKKRVKKGGDIFIRKLLSGVSLLAFFVVLLACVRAEVSFFAATWRAFIVMLVLKVISVIVIRILASYEEMNSGEA